MKRCITEHVVASFGTIPVGSLWEDDSPFLSDDTAEHFVEVEDTPAPVAVPVKRKPPIRRFGEKVSG